MSSRKLARAVQVPASGGVLWLALGVVTAFVIGSIIVVGPILLDGGGQSKVDIARHDVATFRALRAIDPWGAPYRIVRFARSGVIVYSAGEDGVAGTADDIWSDR